jgi:hypothetical protein
METQALELTQDLVLQKMYLSQIRPHRISCSIVEMANMSAAMGVACNTKTWKEGDAFSVFFGELMFLAADTATTNGSSETRLAFMKGKSRNGTYQPARSNKRIPHCAIPSISA